MGEAEALAPSPTAVTSRPQPGRTGHPAPAAPCLPLSPHPLLRRNTMGLEGQFHPAVP